MAFNKQQLAVNYTVMVTKAANGFILQLLNEDGETIMTAIASDCGLRDYSSYNFVTAMESLWEYAEQLERAKLPPVAEAREADTAMELLHEAAVLYEASKLEL